MIASDIFLGLQELLQETTESMWLISPVTVDSLRLAHHFPEPTRKLRKCYLRRIQARKRAWMLRRKRREANERFLSTGISATLSPFDLVNAAFQLIDDERSNVREQLHAQENG